MRQMRQTRQPRHAGWKKRLFFPVSDGKENEEVAFPELREAMQRVQTTSKLKMLGLRAHLVTQPRFRADEHHVKSVDHPIEGRVEG